MNKKGQEQLDMQSKPKSNFVVKLIGFFLVFISLSWLVNVSTNEWLFLVLAGISGILAIFSLMTKRKFALVVSIVLTLALLGLYFLEFVSDFLLIFAEVLTNKYVLPIILLASAIALLIVGNIWYKILGLFLFVALIINSVEFFVNLHDIFSFLEPLLKYDISLSWPVLLIIGFICLFGFGGVKKGLQRGFNASKDYAGKYAQKQRINRAHESAIGENISRDREKAKKMEIERRRKLRDNVKKSEEEEKRKAALFRESESREAKERRKKGINLTG